MDKWEAQYQFWSGFGVPAYEENSVPDRDKIQYPYITYQSMSGGFEDTVSLSASIWTRSSSWEEADRLADAVYNSLKHGGVYIACENNEAVWICTNPPFAQSMGDQYDDLIKRKLLSVMVQFV